MSECPECDADVPADGKFCPECGAQLGDAPGGTGGRRSAGHRDERPGSSGQHRTPPRESGAQQDQRSTETSEDWKYPADSPTDPAEPRPEDHKLLLGSVAALSLIGLLEGLGRALSPGTFATEVMAAAEDAGMELEQAFAEQIIIATGVFGILLGLVALGLTVKNYRDNVIPKWYFWVLIGVGVTGFLLASNLLLTLLVAFGIYGLVSVAN